MPEFLKTTREGKHDHIVFVTENTGMGQTTESNGHFHRINVQHLDFATGEEIEPRWIVEFIDNHTHELAPIVIKEEKKEEKEEGIVQEVAEMFFEIEKLEEDSRLRGYESEDMYMNKQWDEKLKKKLASEDRAAVTINKIEQKIDNLCGYQRQNRTDFHFLPVEGGDQAVSDILTYLFKHITEQCYYSREESKVFEDTAITGRGLFNIHEDFDRNIQGDIVIEKYPWDEGYIGVHHKEDLSDCDVIFKEKWYSERKIKEIYPDKFEKLSEEIKKRPSSDTRSEDWDKRLTSLAFIDLTAKKYRLIERQMKTYKRSFILVNAENDFVYAAEGWPESDVTSVRRDIPGFVKIPRISFKIRVTRIISNVLVEDEMTDEEDFPLVPLYAKKRNNEWWGKLDGVKDLNRLINKAYSQFLDILNKVANYGWFYDSETFRDPRDKKAFQKNAAKPGFTQEIADINRPPAKVEGVKFPDEIVNAISMFNNDMREIMNINLEFMGQGNQPQSGVAIKQKIVQQLLGNDYLFDNLSFIKKQIGRIVVKKIQKLYTPERIMRILMNQNAQQIARKEEPLTVTMPQTTEPMLISDIDPDAIFELLQNADITKNDVIVSESESSPSAMMGNFLILMELAGKGIQIPPEAILEFAPLPHKDKIIQIIREGIERQMMQENKKYDTEIAKSLIAQGQGGQSLEGGTESFGRGGMI